MIEVESDAAAAAPLPGPAGLPPPAEACKVGGEEDDEVDDDNAATFEDEDDDDPPVNDEEAAAPVAVDDPDDADAAGAVPLADTPAPVLVPAALATVPPMRDLRSLVVVFSVRSRSLTTAAFAIVVDV